jgi:hypothetical protein
MGAATDVTETVLSNEPEEREPAKLERDVEGIRDNITDIVSELDRRGHEMLDWRGHLRKHAWLLVAVGASCLVGLGVTVVADRARRKRRNRFWFKARRIREAVARIIEHPELVAQPKPGIARKALGAAVGATTTVLAKTLVQQIVDTIEPSEEADAGLG